MKTWLRIRGLWVAVVLGSIAIFATEPANAAWDAKQLKQVRAATISLRAAILTAERDLKGKSFFAAANVGSDGLTYTIRVFNGEKPMMAQVDAKTGRIGESSPLTGENLATLKEFAKLKSGLLPAIKAAEATAKGKSFEAAFKRIGNKLVFEIDVAGRDDIEKDVLVDALTGKIRKVSERSTDAGSTGGTTSDAGTSPVQ